VRKRHFLRHLYIKINILPRQARDEHRENSKKVPFSLSDDPKGALLELLVLSSKPESSTGTAAANGAAAAAEEAAAFRSELQGLRLKDLRKRARDGGIGAQLLEDAADADDPKSAVIELLMDKKEHNTSLTAQEADSEAALRSELDTLRLKELRSRAKTAGVSADDLEDAADSDDPKGYVIQLLLAHGSSRVVAEDRPHFGSGGKQVEKPF
jgi:hypothetical protein